VRKQFTPHLGEAARSLFMSTKLPSTKFPGRLQTKSRTAWAATWMFRSVLNARSLMLKARRDNHSRCENCRFNED